MKKLLIFTIGFSAFVGFSFTGFASGNSITNVRAFQRSDGTDYVDIYYDLAAADPRICEVYYSIDGGSTFSDSMTSLSGDTGEGVPPGNNKHVVWDAGRTLPDVMTECKIRIKVTFWVGYSKIPKIFTKSVPEKDTGNGQAESLLKSVVPEDIIDKNHTVNRKPSDTLVEYFQKRICYIIVRQSDSPPFQLNTASDISDAPDMPDAPDAPKEPGLPVISVNTQLMHAPTLDEWGKIVFFILLVIVSISKLRSTHPHS